MLFAQYDLTDCVGYTSHQRLCVRTASAYLYAELYTRQPATDHRLLTETRELAAVLDLSSVDCTLPLARLYQGVELAGVGAAG